jgi:hypothetical protein
MYCISSVHVILVAVCVLMISMLSEGKDFIVSIENKMEDLFNLESDIVDLAMSIDTRKTDVEEAHHGNVKLSFLQNFLARYLI